MRLRFTVGEKSQAALVVPLELTGNEGVDLIKERVELTRDNCQVLMPERLIPHGLPVKVMPKLQDQVATSIAC